MRHQLPAPTFGYSSANGAFLNSPHKEERIDVQTRMVGRGRRVARRVHRAPSPFLLENTQLHHGGRARGRCWRVEWGQPLPEATERLPGQRACRGRVLALLREDAQGNLPGARSAPSLAHPGAGSRTRPPCPPCQARSPPGCRSRSDPVQASGIAGRDIPPPRPCTLSDTKLVFSV